MSNEAGTGPSGAWESDLGLAAALSDAVVLAPGGAIAWVNAAFCRLMGQGEAELLGTDGLTLVHPDEMARAIDGIEYAARFPGRTAVAPYRIRRSDGTWLDIELKSGILARPDGDHVTLVVRDGTSRRDINRAWRSVANGDPLGTTTGIVGQAVGNRWPGSAMAVSIGVRGGGREVLGLPLPSVLAEHARGLLGDAGVVPPWDLVSDGDDGVAVVDRAELPAVLQSAADEAGFEGFAVARLADPVGQPACLVVWFDHTVIGRLEFRHAAAELTDLLGLALDRRHHLFQLWHVASHDSLTGLYNRAGFFERFAEAIDASRREGAKVALLFVDIDGLKGINDQGGHAAGDRLLVDAAHRLRSVVGADGIIARLGGDEFVVAVTLPADQGARAAEALAEQVVEAMAQPGPSPRSAADRGSVAVAASVGLAVDDGDLAHVRILEAADAAMYRAKSAGRSRWAW